MPEFYNLKKLKLILIGLNFMKYAAWCGFFIFQGKAIQLALEKNQLLSQLLQTLLWFILTKLLVMLADLTDKFAIAYFENDAMARQWKTHFPRRLYQDNENKNNLLYLAYFDHLPNLYHMECAIINNQCTILSVFSIVVSLLLYTGFYLGLAALLAVFTLNFFSKNICRKRLDYYHETINTQKAHTLGWINQYFKAYREISCNWREQIDAWRQNAYAGLYQAKKQSILVQLLRDLMAQCMVEIPFILNTSLVILAVYQNYLSITELFVWVGFSQFVISASNAFLENKVNQDKKKNLTHKMESISAAFKTAKRTQQKHETRHQATAAHTVAVKLQDNTLNALSLQPGIYHIKGANGSGKSTLLNVVMGYEREIAVHNHARLQQMLSGIAEENIRVIERDPVIFDALPDFNAQILGPETSKTGSWVYALEVKLDGILSHACIQALVRACALVEEKFHSRENRRFSSGEKVLVSLMRTLSSWDRKVSIVLVDECTTFLDTGIKGLFLQSLSELAAHAAVYLSAHEPLSLETPAGVSLEVV